MTHEQSTASSSNERLLQRKKSIITSTINNSPQLEKSINLIAQSATELQLSNQMTNSLSAMSTTESSSSPTLSSNSSSSSSNSSSSNTSPSQQQQHDAQVKDNKVVINNRMNTPIKTERSQSTAVCNEIENSS
jgi:hypothetical protein